MLAKCVHDDQFEVWKCINDFIYLVSQQRLVAVINDANEVNARQNLVNRELISVLAMLSRVLVNVLEHLGSQALGHVCNSLNSEVSMRIDEKSLPIDSSKGPRHLHIEAELKTHLGLARACQTAHLDDLSKAKDNVEKVFVRVVCLH